MNVVTVVSSTDNDGFRQLKRSCDYFNIELDVVIAPFTFGGQMPFLYRWCKSLDEQGLFKYFIYTDGWDTFFVSDMQEIVNKLLNYDMILSSEKGCFPNTDLEPLFPRTKLDWRYVNGGGFYTNTKFFVQLYENNLPESPHDNDQEWLSMMFLKYQDKITLDYNCEIFQTLMFAGEGDFTLDYEKSRLYNNKTNSIPVILHANGLKEWLLHSVDTIYKLLPEKTISRKIEHFNKEFSSWFTYPRLYRDMVNKFPSGSKFIEVGSYVGGSFSYLVTEIVNSGKDIDVTSIDIFLGDLLQTFKHNMSPVEGYYNTIVDSSLNASKQFEDGSLDFVFIDADHSYESVKEDILTWIPKIKKGGILAGHDYIYLQPGVVKAVDEMFKGDFNRSYIDELCWMKEIV